MRLHLTQGHAVRALTVLLLAGCSAERPTEPADTGSSNLPAGLEAQAIALRVDVAAGTVTPIEGQGAPASRTGPSFALFGPNEVTATASHVTRSALGQFTPKKVTVRFNLRLTNRTSVAMLQPTFPVPPSGVHALLLFPFSTSVALGIGTVAAGADFDGGLTNFFNDANCGAGASNDCYRYEPYPAPLAPGGSSERAVGFDVSPTVLAFTVYFVLAADLEIPGSIAGTVTAPGFGPLSGVTVTLNPSGRSATPAAGTGTYGFTAVSPGTYTLSLSGLPTDCLAPPKPVTVVSGSAATVNFAAICQLIAFSSERTSFLGADIYVMHRDGSQQRRITLAGVPFEDVEVAWSPDGRTLAFERSDLSANANEDPDAELYTVDVDTGIEHQLTNNASLERSPTWSPDGSKIAFVSDRDGPWDVYLMNPDGSGVTRLTNSPLAEFGLAWSPDGSRIAFGGTPSIFGLESDVYVMNANGTGVTKITTTGTDSHPAWSPDGSRIAFQSDRNGQGLREIYVMDANGQNQTRLTVGGESQLPTWSPDGAKIAFTRSSHDSGSLDMYSMNVDGSGIVRLTSAPGFDNFAAFQR